MYVQVLKVALHLSQPSAFPLHLSFIKIGE